METGSCSLLPCTFCSKFILQGAKNKPGFESSLCDGNSRNSPSNAVCVLSVGNGKRNKERIPRWEPG